MGWSAFATQPHGPPLPTTLVNGQLELMDHKYSERFHQARDRVVGKTQAVDDELYRGGLGLHGSGRVLSLIAGHGGSISCLDRFCPLEAAELCRGADMLDPSFVISQLMTMGFDPVTDPLSVYFWSAIEFVRTCTAVGAGIACHRC